jgi:hypothetical protein
MFPIACYQATGRYFAHSASNDRFPAISNAQNPAIPRARSQSDSGSVDRFKKQENFSLQKFQVFYRQQ